MKASIIVTILSSLIVLLVAIAAATGLFSKDAGGPAWGETPRLPVPRPAGASQPALTASPGGGLAGGPGKGQRTLKAS